MSSTYIYYSHSFVFIIEFSLLYKYIYVLIYTYSHIVAKIKDKNFLIFSCQNIFIVFELNKIHLKDIVLNFFLK